MKLKTFSPQSKLGKGVRNDFPFYQHNPKVVFLDSAASSLTPYSVTEEVSRYYDQYSVNIHRGVYHASMEATKIYEDTRQKIASFIKADRPEEIIYIRNATEGFNLLAYTLSATEKLDQVSHLDAWKTPLQKNDTIILSESEHHANIVPWQILAQRIGLRIEYIRIEKETGQLSMEHFEKLKQIPNIKIISLGLVSNVSGIVHNLKYFSSFAREKGILFIVDAAQAICHIPIDIKELDPDFFIFSGHKMLGPTGIGILWGRREILERMPPFMGGGDMILKVSKEATTFKSPPHKFEAGTPHIAGVFGLSSAIDYLQNIGMKKIYEHEEKLTQYALQKLEQYNAIIYGPKLKDIRSKKIQRIGAISFGLKEIHPHDIGTILDQNNIAIRAGHHCCQILMRAWNISATCRASLYLYNDIDDIDHLIHTLDEVNKIFNRLSQNG